MEFQELEMYNFIAYKGQNIISFVSQDAQDTITTIHGDSGLGKTSIYRAFAAALFADPITGQKDINYFQICNEIALSEANGDMVDSFVKLKFTQEDKKYSIKRTFRSIHCENGKVKEDLISHELIVIHGTEKKVFTNPLEISIIFNPLFSQLRNYFLFNGERVERLEGKRPSEQRQEVVDGIRNLLGFNAVERSLKALNLLIHEQQVEVSKLLQNKAYDAKKQQLIQKFEEIQKKNNDIKELENLINRRKAAIIEFDKELKQIDAIKNTIALRDQLESRLEEQRNNKGELLNNCGILNRQACFLLAENCFHSVKESVEAISEGYDLPQDVSIPLLEHIISKGECPICTNKVSPESEQMGYVLSLLQKIRENPGISDIRSFRDILIRIIESIQPGRSKVIQQLKEYRNCKTAVQRTEYDLEKLYENLGEQKEFDLSRKIKERDIVITDLIRLQSKYDQLIENIPYFEKQFKNLEQEIRTLEANIALGNTKMQMKILSEKAYQALQGIHDQFVENIRSKLEKVATDILRTLQGDANNPVMARVIINSDFSLDVKNWIGNNFVANISEGQREILAIAFVLALLEVSRGNGEIPTIPIIMDSSFMRFSTDKKKALLHYIPGKAAQTIFLVTDSEVTNSDLDILRRSGKWANAYRLASVENGNTTIIKENPLTFKL